MKKVITILATIFAVSSFNANAQFHFESSTKGLFAAAGWCYSNGTWAHNKNQCATQTFNFVVGDTYNFKSLKFKKLNYNETTYYALEVSQEESFETQNKVNKSYYYLYSEEDYKKIVAWFNKETTNKTLILKDKTCELKDSHIISEWDLTFQWVNDDIVRFVFPHPIHENYNKMFLYEKMPMNDFYFETTPKNILNLITFN